MTALRIDLNCDLGESVSTSGLGDDDRIMPSISSANVACGVHAGNPSVMRRTVELALGHGVSIGAHPGYPDRAGFGRRPMSMSTDAVEDLVQHQLGTLAGIVAAQGGTLHHLKPHGALYHLASVDRSVADAVARATHRFDPALVLYGLSGSRLLEAGRARDLAVASEVFADRAYQADGSLVPRRAPDAVIGDPASVVERAVGMVTDGRVQAIDGGWVGLQAETMCLHGDTAGAVDLAARLRAGLEAAGVVIAPVAHIDRRLDGRSRD